MFSSTAEYALRAVAFLATRADAPASSETIADAVKVPHSYLLKVLGQLAVAGVVEGKRGPAGGYRLARSAEALTLLEIINAVDPINRIRTCPLGIPSHGTRLCRVHKRMDEAIAGVEETLAGATIAEMIAEDRPVEQCAFPAPSKPQRITMRDRKGRR